MNRIKVSEDTYIFDEGGVRFFLLTGTERALLIDSGMQTRNAKELAEELTALPIELLNTHADRDHTASNGEFARFYMNPAEFGNYYRSGGLGEAVPVWDGDVIDLGSRPLRIIAMPGHTPGSVAVLDVNSRRLFSGDPIQDGRIFMFGVWRDLRAYICSLDRLMTMTGDFDAIYPSHGSCPVGKELIPALRAAAADILGGKLKGTPEEMFGTKVTAYDTGVAVILGD